MDFDELNASTQAAALRCVKDAHGLPIDIAFHRSLDRSFAKDVDECSVRVLTLANRLLALAAASNYKDKSKQIAELDDVVDNFHSMVVDPLDILLEKADACMDEALGRTKPPAIMINPPVATTLLPPKTSMHARPQTSRSDRLDATLLHAAHLPKPQLFFKTPVDNSNLTAWKPKLIQKYHTPQPPLDNDQELDSDSLYHYHPYRFEINHISYPSRMFQHLPPQSPNSFETTPFTWVSTPSQLSVLIDKLSAASEIAVDLEHQSFRSFYGFVCLMQISTRQEDFIIDTIALREDLQQLNKVFTDSNTIKVFHGAESDVIWLQQDFGIYVINLFDTYHASRALDFPRHSLAALLSVYCDFVADKKYQLADWRIRPLPDEMMYYARSDTHFLLCIYDNMRNALLDRAQGQHDLIRDVLNKSAETALRTYVKEIYDAEGGSGPNGWETLGQKWNKHLTGVQMSVYRAIHGWRDKVAREEDESTRYVLPNKDLFRLVERIPNDVEKLLSSFSLVPPLVKTHASRLLDVIREATAATVKSDPSTDTVKPPVQRDDTAHLNPAEPSLFDRTIHPVHMQSVGSSLFGSALWSRSPPPVASSSTFLGAAYKQHPVRDSRYQAVMSRIHGSLVVTSSLTKFPDVPLVSIDVDEPEPAVEQGEIVFVPSNQRLTKPVDDGEDSVVIAGQARTKRKRRTLIADGDLQEPGSRSKKKKPLEKFDYSAVPNILDQDSNANQPMKMPKSEKKRPVTAVQYGNFPPAPKAASETKSGNRSHTFH